MAAASRSRKTQERAKAKAKDAETAKVKAGGKLKEEAVVDGLSDHRLRCDGMEVTAMTKETSQNSVVQILSKWTKIAVACISMLLITVRPLLMEVTFEQYHLE